MTLNSEVTEITSQSGTNVDKIMSYSVTCLLSKQKYEYVLQRPEGVPISAEATFTAETQIFRVEACKWFRQHFSSSCIDLHRKFDPINHACSIAFTCPSQLRGECKCSQVLSTIPTDLAPPLTCG